MLIWIFILHKKLKTWIINKKLKNHKRVLHTLFFMSVVLPKFADQDKIKEDIAEVGVASDTPIQQKIDRADEDASSAMQALFLNNFDPNNLEPFFVQITTEYATALFWVKSNGTEAALTQAEEVYKKAERILEQRFLPVGSRS